VDFAACALVSILQKEASLGRNHHLIHPRPTIYRNLLELANECGYQVQVLSTREWEQHLVHGPLELRKNPLAAYLLFLPTDTQKPLHDAGVLPDLDAANVVSGLSGTEVVCPPLDRALMETSLKHFVSILGSSFRRRPVRRVTKRWTWPTQRRRPWRTEPAHSSPESRAGRQSWTKKREQECPRNPQTGMSTLHRADWGRFPGSRPRPHRGQCANVPTA